MPNTEQDRLLDLAADVGWSSAALREEVAKIRGALMARNPGVHIEHVERKPGSIQIFRLPVGTLVIKGDADTRP